MDFLQFLVMPGIITLCTIREMGICGMAEVCTPPSTLVVFET